MRLVPTAIAVSISVAAALIGVHQLGKARDFQLFGTLVSHVKTQDKVVALTFDDGPTLRFTRGVLDMLDEKGVKATFFLTGQELETAPAMGQDIARRGHQIGNHSFSHRSMAFMAPSTIKSEIERTDSAIRATGYSGSIDVRPPYGKKLVTLPWYLSQTDRRTITWDVEPESDAAIADDPNAIAEDVLRQTRNGSIILMHVMYKSREASRQALPLVIDGLRERGFSFVTISELLRHST